MDEFGIGAALQTSLQLIKQAQTQTGRSTRLISDYQEGDVIICSTHQGRQHLEQMAREHNKQITCLVIDPKDPRRLFERGTPAGRCRFDHRWIEEFYEINIQGICNSIQRFQDEASGYGEPHRKTKRAANARREWL